MDLGLDQMTLTDRNGIEAIGSEDPDMSNTHEVFDHRVDSSPLLTSDDSVSYNDELTLDSESNELETGGEMEQSENDNIEDDANADEDDEETLNFENAYEFPFIETDYVEVIDAVSPCTQVFDENTVEAYTCPVCLDILYLPHTCRPCGHVFCGPCLRRVKGKGKRTLFTSCPLCRTPICVCVPKKALHRMVKKMFPLDFYERKTCEAQYKGKLPPLPRFKGELPYRKTREEKIRIIVQTCFMLLLGMLGAAVLITLIAMLLIEIPDIVKIAVSNFGVLFGTMDLLQSQPFYMETSIETSELSVNMNDSTYHLLEAAWHLYNSSFNTSLIIPFTIVGTVMGWPLDDDTGMMATTLAGSAVSNFYEAFMPLFSIIVTYILSLFAVMSLIIFTTYYHDEEDFEYLF